MLELLNAREILKLFASLVMVSFIITGCGGGNTTTAADTGNGGGTGSGGGSGSGGGTGGGGSGSGGDGSGSGGGGSGSGTPTGSNSVALNWVAPDSYTTGELLNDLAGHKVYVKFGTGSFQLVSTINNPNTVSLQVDNLGTGQFVFAVTAYNSKGVESARAETQLTL